MYLTFKTIHLTFALVSITGFLFRSFLMFRDSPLLGHKVVQVVPHVVDSVFLLSGFSMAFLLNFGLFSQGWLTMKLFSLMLYLFFVGVALARGTTKSIRIAAFFCALFTFSYIVGVAMTKTAASWFALG